MSIKINVGGTIFETSELTLRKITYFNDLLNDTNLNVNDILFVDRSAHIFKHVLALAIDDTYKYPKKYLKELGFYGVTCDVESLYNPNENLHIIEKSISNIKNELKELRNEIVLLIPEDLVCGLGNCTNKKIISKYCLEHNNICDYVIGNWRTDNEIFCGKETNSDDHRCYSHYMYS